MKSLVIEASTYVGSAAVLNDGCVVAERTVAMRGREHEALMPAVADVLSDAGIRPGELDRVVCGAGPGAFTSLRIAGGIAKGIALGAGVPLYAVSSLALIVAARQRAPGRYLAAVDAMRGEQYVQLFSVDEAGQVREAGGMSLMHADGIHQAAEAAGAVPVGPGQVDEGRCDPLAAGACHVTKMIETSAAADLARWEPAYGRLAEAQVKWEAANGRPLVSA